MPVMIISGGPGAGKTTLLQGLAQHGYHTYPEVPRQLIEQQSVMADGILPWHNLAGFAALCYQAMREQQQLAQQQALLTSQPVFVDRAIGDICAYLWQAELPVPAEYRQASLGYHRQVLMCEPNRITYQADEVRPYSFEQALHIHHQLVNTYTELGYHCITVPMASIEQRVAFALASLAVTG
ncbi:AAA family ATPase [Vibrio sp. dsl-7]|uniref:AAA family ATPase n=1 Tax=Vibrio chanodichtyis TaxID=3027932 RepID=A0ABT5UZR8_9VIBR|nr:AAA family ATPase [Vibrio chanodichtyis]MDE1514900.1 AAA family ATPase [Vibrio chanodichtyis]